MPYALRKSVGPFSANTRVKILADNYDGTSQIEVLVHEPQSDEKYRPYDYEDLVFDINNMDLVEIRNRVDVVPKVSRSKRREFLRRLFAKARANNG